MLLTNVNTINRDGAWRIPPDNREYPLGNPWRGYPNKNWQHKRCIKLRRKNGLRCRKWACTGSKYCLKHGGGKVKYDRESKCMIPRLYRERNMPKAYSRYLTRTLSEALAEQTNVSPQEQLQLYDELALMRDAAGQAVKLYSAAREAAEKDPTNAVKQGFVHSTSAIMREQLKEVVQICEAAVRIENSAKDKISINQLHFFIQQIVRAAYTVLGDDVATVQRLEHTIRKTVRLPSSGIEGTVVTPEMDVMAMDALVPKEPQKTHE